MRYVARKSTPVLFVDAIEPSLVFLAGPPGLPGHSRSPHGDTRGFAILVSESAEIMLQSVASREADAASYARAFDGDRTWLFVELQDLAAIETALDGLRSYWNGAQRSTASLTAISSRSRSLLAEHQVPPWASRKRAFEASSLRGHCCAMSCRRARHSGDPSRARCASCQHSSARPGVSAAATASSRSSCSASASAPMRSQARRELQLLLAAPA